MTVDFEEIKRKMVIKGRTIKLKAIDATNKVLNWADKNPEKFVATVSTGACVLYRAYKGMRKYSDEHKHDKEIYDPSLQMWHPIRRELSYSEELYYKTSIRNGRNAVDVLKEMRLYK